MKAMCIKDVIMNDDQKVFTKGKTYSVYEATCDSGPCLRTHNDLSYEHVIHSGELELFFKDHFELTV